MTSTAQNDREYPELTEAGPRTTEYEIATAEGYVNSPSGSPSLTATVNGGNGGNVEKSGDEHGIQHVDGHKIVTWKVDDPENPRNWGKGRKWLYTMVISLMVS